MGDSLEQRSLAALLVCVPAEKCRAVAELGEAWQAGSLNSLPLSAAMRIEIPGRPARPALVAAEQLPRRNPRHASGQAALLHAVAHIEFNAINLALDCVYRFSVQGAAFVNDWLRVAGDEARHFQMLCERLHDLGYAYGDFPAHNGLWEMALQTDHDFLARMALVPRLLEARGLDATPPIQARLREIGDQPSLAILEVILRDEIDHVAIGDRWFRAECALRGLEPETAFRQLLRQFEAPWPRPPLNRAARQLAGFSLAELDILEAGRNAPG